jgi:hemolysin III
VTDNAKRDPDRLALSRVDSATSPRPAFDELLNTSTHALGLFIAVIGALVMTSRVFKLSDTWLSLSCEAYVASLVTMYAMSTLSHFSTSPKSKSLFRRLDQAFIYILIVATYTPFSLAYLREGRWWLLLAVMWIVALTGFAAKLFFAHRVEAVSIVSYVLLGWMPILAVPALWHSAPVGAIVSVIVGGLCYTIGTFFLVYDEHVRHFHATWHLFVIAGSACHFFGILVFVVGGRN